MSHQVFVACIGSLVSTCVMGFWFLISIKCIRFETIFGLIHVCVFFSLVPILLVVKRDVNMGDGN